MIVVAAASPLHYLVLIEHIAVLSLLYGQVSEGTARQSVFEILNPSPEYGP